MRFILRFLGLWLLAGAFVALIVDGTTSIAGNSIRFMPLGETWFAIHQNSLLLLQPAIERHVAVWLWDPIVVKILNAPGALVLAVIGTLLILLGRKKRPLIGYARN